MIDIRQCIVCNEWLIKKDMEEARIGYEGHREIIRAICNECLNKITHED